MLLPAGHAERMQVLRYVVSWFGQVFWGGEGERRAGSCCCLRGMLRACKSCVTS
jgi:hypothetical protein